MLPYKYKFYKPDSILKKLLKLDWLLLFLVLMICIIGVGALYSAGDGNLNPWAINHLYKIILGFLMVFILSQFRINFIMSFSLILYIFCILCLIYYLVLKNIFFFSTIRIIFNFSKIFY